MTKASCCHIMRWWTVVKIWLFLVRATLQCELKEKQIPMTS